MFDIAKNLRRIIIIVFGLLIIGSLALFLFMSEGKANKALEDEASEAMLHMVRQTAKNIDIELQGRFMLLEALANINIMRGGFRDTETTLQEKLEMLQNENQRLERLGFKRFGLINELGTAYYTDGRTLYLGDREHFQRALRGENFISSIFVGKYEKESIFAYTTPIRDHQNNKIIGVLFAAADAIKLSELVSSISYGKSGYAFIVDKSGKIIAHKDFLDVLNGMNILDNQFLTSFQNFGDIASKMVKGEEGQGLFLKDEKVWSIAYTSIPTTHWSIAIVAPNEEIHSRASALKNFLLQASTIVTIIALILTYLIANIISKYQKRIEHEKVQRAQELILAQNHYEMIFENNAAGMYVVDENRNIITVNERFCEIFGYSKVQIIGQNLAILHVNQTAYENFANRYITIENELQVNTEYQLKQRGGKAFWCELLGTSVAFSENKKGVVWSVVDIDKRKKIEKDNEHLRQLHAMLSQCNQAIVYSKNETELFNTICKDTVKFGEIKMAFIGIVDLEKETIEVVASSGEGVAYLENVSFSTKEDTPLGCGPSGIAFRENRPVWIQDFQHDELTAPWHDRSLDFGWKSSAALPLHRHGKAIGIFALYSGQINIFNHAIKKLLLEMARDIDYALDGYEKDIQRARVEEKLHQLSQAVEQSPSSIVITDLDSNIVYVNTTFINVTGYSAQEVIGQNPRILNSGKTPMSVFTDMWENLVEGKSWRGEFINKRKDGSEYIESVNTSPITQVDGIITHYMAIKEDITDKKHTEERILQLANFDHLTGLPSRIPLQDHFKYLLGLSKRNKTTFAVMYLDLDHFKEINDTLGHNIGDLLLIEASARLQSLMRETDIVSRLGGDEFIVVLPEADMKGAEQVAKKLLEIVSQSYQINENELNVTVSIGIALYPLDGEDMETLSKNADTAMYQAKSQGRNGYRFFTEAMQIRSLHNLRLSNALHHAIERHELKVYFQPQISLNDGRIVGAEALLRWFHPELGYISPFEFIPVAEESGQMLAIGEWVLRTTVEQAKKWIDQGFPAMSFSVNLSAYQFRHPSLPELVTQILNQSGLDPKYLELELTESMAMHDPEGAISIMNNLHQRGIRLSIDDFGTGYSSLSYLKKFKVYKLKIDQSFVRDIAIDFDDRAIVKAVIMMADSLGMITIAEGVETLEQLNYLKEQGCEEVQGYYYSKPLSVDKFEAFVNNYSITEFLCSDKQTHLPR